MHAAPPSLPAAIVFRTASDGLLGTSRDIELTDNGGRTWRVVFRAPRPVVSVTFDPGGRPRAVLDDGENLAPAYGWRDWRPTVAPGPMHSPCPPGYDISRTSGPWTLCIGQGSAGSGGKAVYRRTPAGERRVAYTPFPPPGHGYGGISPGGYAEGIAMAHDGFGIIWESRGTLYVTRDGGSRWDGLPRVAAPEVDFGLSGSALPHGVAFVLLERGGVHVRLLETTDAGRSWHVVHRWG